MSKCSICDRELFSVYETQQAKMFDHGGESYIVCQKCQKELGSTDAIQRQIAIASTKVANRREQEREDAERLSGMVLTTTSTVEGRAVDSYVGIVGAQAIEGVNLFKDVFAGLRNVVGGRSVKLQETMESMRESALEELKLEAYKKGANAVIGIKVDFDEYSEGMLMLSVSGTAVVLSV